MVGGSLRARILAAVLSPLKLNSKGESSLARGKSIAFSSPPTAAFFDRRAARIIQAQQQRGFVERLAGGIVAGFAEQAVIARRARMPQLRVSARSEQREIFARLVRRDKIRIRIRIREAQKRRQNVRFEMIDGDSRQPPTRKRARWPARRPRARRGRAPARPCKRRRRGFCAPAASNPNRAASKSIIGNKRRK